MCVWHRIKPPDRSTKDIEGRESVRETCHRGSDQEDDTNCPHCPSWLIVDGVQSLHIMYMRIDTRLLILCACCVPETIMVITMDNWTMWFVTIILVTLTTCLFDAISKLWCISRAVGKWNSHLPTMRYYTARRILKLWKLLSFYFSSIADHHFPLGTYLQFAMQFHIIFRVRLNWWRVGEMYVR